MCEVQGRNLLQRESKSSFWFNFTHGHRHHLNRDVPCLEKSLAALFYNQWSKTVTSKNMEIYGIYCIILQELPLFQAKWTNPLNLRHECRNLNNDTCLWANHVYLKAHNFFITELAWNLCCWASPAILLWYFFTVIEK